MSEDERLLSSIVCAKCGRPIDGWVATRKAEHGHILKVKVECHGTSETRDINLLELAENRRSGAIVKAMAFDEAA